MTQQEYGYYLNNYILWSTDVVTYLGNEMSANKQQNSENN